MKTNLLYLAFMLLPLLGNSQVPRILWWFDTDDSSFGQCATDDIDQDDKYEIVFGCYRNDSMIYALNAEDGSLLWKFNASGAGEGTGRFPWTIMCTMEPAWQISTATESRNWWLVTTPENCMC